MNPIIRHPNMDKLPSIIIIKFPVFNFSLPSPNTNNTGPMKASVKARRILLIPF